MTAHYLNSTELGALLGMTPNAVKLARKAAMRGEARWKLFTPDVIVGAGGSGSEYGWAPERAEEIVAAHSPDDPALLGDDPSSLPDGFLIGRHQFAALAGVSPNLLAQWRYRGKLPPEDVVAGRVPRWRMGTYRRWAAGRGKNISEEE